MDVIIRNPCDPHTFNRIPKINLKLFFSQIIKFVEIFKNNRREVTWNEDETGTNLNLTRTQIYGSEGCIVVNGWTIKFSSFHCKTTADCK